MHGDMVGGIQKVKMIYSLKSRLNCILIKQTSYKES